jgi:hypothetical protein
MNALTPTENLIRGATSIDNPPKSEALSIPAPRFETLMFKIVGTAPYMQARFSEKAKNAMREKHEAGSVSKKGRKREARDFDDDYQQAMHKSTQGWCGVPAGAFRAAAISACRLVGFKMTMAKLSLFIEADGFDEIDGTPLVRIHGEPEKTEMMVRNATGVADIRVRPLWRDWTCDLRVRFDCDQFTRLDVANLLLRVGMQVGVGEGRPDSKSSNGLGFGLFTTVDGNDAPANRKRK